MLKRSITEFCTVPAAVVLESMLEARVPSLFWKEEKAAPFCERPSNRLVKEAERSLNLAGVGVTVVAVEVVVVVVVAARARASRSAATRNFIY